MKNQVRHNDEEDVKHEDIEFEEVELTVRISQGGKGQSLKVFKKEEGYAETELQHIDDMFEKKKVQKEWLTCLLETLKQEKGIVDNKVEMSKVMEEAGADTIFPKLIMLASIQRTVKESIATV